MFAMKAYVVVVASAGTGREIADATVALPGVRMSDACWGGGDVYAVVEFPEWKALNGLVLDRVHSMPGLIRAETHLAVERKRAPWRSARHYFRCDPIAESAAGRRLTVYPTRRVAQDPSATYHVNATRVKSQR